MPEAAEVLMEWKHGEGRWRDECQLVKRGDGSLGVVVKKRGLTRYEPLKPWLACGFERLIDEIDGMRAALSRGDSNG